MAKPKDDPTTSINLLANRTEGSTTLGYNEKQNLDHQGTHGGIKSLPTLIRIQMLGILDHRDVALRAGSAACKIVTRRPQGKAWNDFRMQVVSAVGEAFNNIVLHGYEGRGDGVIEMEIRTRPERISIEMRDYGSSFDPTTVPEPDFDSLPESGWGLFIIKAYMTISYTPGRPNVLTLSKTLEPAAETDEDPIEGAP